MKRMDLGQIKGADGITPELQIGSVSTLPAGSPATVARRASSPDYAPVFDFGIPMGDGALPIAQTSGTGEAYTAAVGGIASLSAGLLLILVPHETSLTASPTLNLNSFGAKPMVRRKSSSTAAGEAGGRADWLSSGKPLLLQYDGSAWVVLGQAKPSAEDMDGVLSLSHGGTGRASFLGNRLLYSLESVEELSAPEEASLLTQSPSGAPEWLPLSGLPDAIEALGRGEKAADSALFNGKAPEYYLSYAHLTGLPEIPPASSALPVAAGAASAGSSEYYSRADHVHPLPTLLSLNAQKKISFGVSEPTGGADGDIYIQY